MSVGAAIGAGSSILGGILGSNASQKASKEQIQAEQQAEQVLEQQEGTALGNYSPYLQAGAEATGTLSQMLGTPGQGLLTPWTQTFTAPTAAQAAATPGYQFQLQQGEAALQNSAAGQGGLLSGATLAGMNNYAQGVASTNYQNTFNNALTQYQQAYQTFLNNQNNTYSRLLGVSQQGLGAAQGAGSTAATFGGDIASLYGQQGAAAAAGTIGSANAINSSLGNLSSLATLYGLSNASSNSAAAQYGGSNGTIGTANTVGALPSDPNNPGYYLPGGIPAPQ